MRVARQITLEGRLPDGLEVEFDVEARELTVGEIRAWLKNSGAVSGDVVDCTLFDEFSLPDLTVLSTISAEQINWLTPTEIHRLEALVREVNSDFFAMRSRVVALGRQALAAS